MKRQKSILVLDDEPAIGEVVMDILAPIYEEVIYCSSGEKAQEFLQSRTFSLILTDVHMPDMPGHEFIKLVRSMGHIEPVIFMTGNATKEVVLSALRLDASDVVEKPFENEELLKSIDRTFEIEKRRFALYESIIQNQKTADQVKGQKKMIGLLHASSLKKSG